MGQRELEWATVIVAMTMRDAQVGELLPRVLYAGNYKSDHNTGSNANLLDK